MLPHGDSSLGAFYFPSVTLMLASNVLECLIKINAEIDFGCSVYFHTILMQ